MTLARRMLIKTLVLLVTTALLAGAALWGIRSLSHIVDDSLQGLADVGENLDVSLAEYRKLRELFSIGYHVINARSLLDARSANTAQILASLQRAHTRLQQFLLDHPGHAQAEDAARVLEETRQAMRAGPEIDPLTVNEYLDRLGYVLSRLGQMSQLTQQTITVQQDQAMRQRETAARLHGAAADQRRIALIMLAGFGLLTGAALVLVSISQYRGVMLPLRRLQQGVREVAAGSFDRRIPTDEDAEFAVLARDFNQMAQQLESLYRDLEAQVNLKSQQLARSERLASVGYLAAGVAHEINNPLGIISGHAELSLRAIDKSQSTQQPPDSHTIRETLQIVRDEAFRCKQITQKLLSLSQRSEEDKADIVLRTAAQEVVELVTRLEHFGGRQLTVEAAPGSENLTVHAHPGEIKQVLLNLAINAVEATDPHTGVIRIRVGADEKHIELVVEDNGHGMTPQTLDRIFEPFFTQRAAGGRRGTGLGLSISHAIIESTGGAVQAHSDGPGLGSRFTITWPREAGA